MLAMAITIMSEMLYVDASHLSQLCVARHTNEIMRSPDVLIWNATVTRL
jgi:hypothetical protein